MGVKSKGFQVPSYNGSDDSTRDRIYTDEEKKRIVVEPLEMTQAFRNFRGGSSAWEQVGPGDDLKPETVSSRPIQASILPSNTKTVQTANTKARAPERGGEEIEDLCCLSCTYLRMNVLMRLPLSAVRAVTCRHLVLVLFQTTDVKSPADQA